MVVIIVYRRSGRNTQPCLVLVPTLVLVLLLLSLTSTLPHDRSGLLGRNTPLCLPSQSLSLSSPSTLNFPLVLTHYP